MPFKFRIDSLHAQSNSYPRGRHLGNRLGLSDTERALVAANIKWGVNVFGIIGTMVLWQQNVNKDLSFSNAPVKIVAATEDHSGGAQQQPLSIEYVPGVTEVENATLSYTVVDDCEVAWTEYVGADVTSTLDNVDFKVGAGSVKLTVAAAAIAGLLATQAHASIDATTYKYVKFWIKSSIAISAGDLVLFLDDHAQCVSPLKQIDIGGLTAGAWTEKTLSLGDTSSLSALISYGVNMAVDKGAFVLNIDQIRFTEGA